MELQFPALPIILMSGYNEFVARGSPGFRVLHKPIPYGELFRSICAAWTSAEQSTSTPHVP